MSTGREGRAWTHPVASEAAVNDLAAVFAAVVKPPSVIYLQGDLGAGKTTFCRGLIRALGHRGKVKSPTYTLVEGYELAGTTVFHFDLYRLAEPEELEYMGIRDYLATSALVLVEWPERGTGVLPVADLDITITPELPGRRLVISGCSDRGQELLLQLAKAVSADS